MLRRFVHRNRQKEIKTIFSQHCHTILCISLELCIKNPTVIYHQKLILMIYQLAISLDPSAIFLKAKQKVFNFLESKAVIRVIHFSTPTLFFWLVPLFGTSRFLTHLQPPLPYNAPKSDQGRRGRGLSFFCKMKEGLLRKRRWGRRTHLPETQCYQEINFRKLRVQKLISLQLNVTTYSQQFFTYPQ